MTAELLFDRGLDLILGALLVSVLVYGMILSRRLANFRSARADLEALVASLSGTIMQARSAVSALTEAGEEAEERLSARLRQARRLTDEMEAMNATSEALAERLEKAATRPRQAARQSSPAPVTPAAHAEHAERPYAPAAKAPPKPGSLAAAIAAIEARQRKAA